MTAGELAVLLAAVLCCFGFAALVVVQAAIGFKPKVPLEEGLKRFVDWFRDYYRS